MNHTDILRELTDYISREVLDGKDTGLDGSTPLLEWGVINSIEMARLVGFIETRFGVKVPAEKIVPAFFKDLTSATNLVLELAHSPHAASDKF